MVESFWMQVDQAIHNITLVSEHGNRHTLHQNGRLLLKLSAKKSACQNVFPINFLLHNLVNIVGNFAEISDFPPPGT